MASEPAIEPLPTPNFEPGREGHSPRAIVVHTTAGTWDGTVAWFADPSSGVSSHYLVGLDGRVAAFVAEGDTARHAGRVSEPTARIIRESDLNPNSFTIGIEFEDGGLPLDARRPPAQYDAGARLIASAAMTWGIHIDREHVIGHREVYSRKECPGNLDVGRLVAEAAALAASLRS